MIGGFGSAWLLVFGIAAFGLLMAWPVLRLISLYADRVLSGGELAVGLVVVVVLGAGLVASWGTVLHWVLWGLAIVLAGGTVAVDRATRKRVTQRLKQEDVAAIQRGLQFDPRNVAAHSRLGDLYLELGWVDQAIAAYQTAVSLAPSDAREKHKLQRVIEMKRRRGSSAVWCPRCRHENPPEAAHCAECGHPLSLKRDLTDLLRSEEIRRSLGWGALISLGGALLALNVGLVRGRVNWGAVGVLTALALICALGFGGSRALGRLQERLARRRPGRNVR